MKKYTVIISHNGYSMEFCVAARNENSACNKAVKRAQWAKNKAITLANVGSVTYEGFYLDRVFFAVNES